MPAALTKEYSCIGIVKGRHPLRAGINVAHDARTVTAPGIAAFPSSAGLTIRAHHDIASHVPDERFVEYAQPLEPARRERLDGSASRRRPLLEDLSSISDRIDDEVATTQLSPELALVDPDLARVARSQMPDLPGSPVLPRGNLVSPTEEQRPGPEPPRKIETPARTSGTAIARERLRTDPSTNQSGDRQPMAAVTAGSTPPLVVANATADRERVLDDIPWPRDRRVRRRRAARALFAVLLLVVASLAVADFRLFGDESASEFRPSTSPADGGSRPSARSARSAVKGKTAFRRGAPAARRSNGGEGSPSIPERARPTGEGSRTPARSPRSARARVAPETRLFVWLPHRRASHYRVEFFRRGKKIFQATTLKARLVLPDRWVFKGHRVQLTPGNYRWTVRPGFGSRLNARYGRPIVSSRWTVAAP
jgi:hypothetical protein